MADEQKECPTCHSYISEDPEKTEQGSEQSGSTVQITDPFTNQQVNVRTSTSGAVPQWTDDPTLTLRGFNGEEYVGFNRIRATHIREIQYARIAEEAEAGLSEEQKTQFSEVFGEHIRKLHIIELRQSTEKILDAVGTDLKTYFTLNALEEEKDPGPNDEPNKEDWTDVARGEEYLDGDGTIKTEFQLPSGTTKPAPSFPAGTHVRAVHIEDLRRPLHLGWREFWSVTPDVVVDVKTTESVVRTENTTYTQGPIVNAPTVVPGGFDDFTEYTLTATPVGFGTRTIPNPSEFVSDTIIEITANEQAQKGFPSGFDLHPTDAGAQYFYDFVDEQNAEPAYGTQTTDPETDEVTFDIDRTWIVEGFCVDRQFSRFGAALFSAGRFCPFEHEVAGSTNADSVSEAKFEIVNTRDALVERAKQTAKTLKLISNSKTNTSVSGVGRGFGPGADSWVSVSHTWVYTPEEDKFFGYPIGRLQPQANFQNFDTWTANKQDDVELFKDRGIGVKFNTHFKFFANLKLEGDTKRFGIPESGLADEITFTNRVRNYERGQLQEDEPVNDFTGMLTWGETNSVLPPIFRTVQGEGEEPFASVPTRDAYAICLLSLKVGSREVFCKLILSDPPTGSTSSFITTSSGAHGGQTFTFIVPPSNNNGDLMTVYLGNGENGKYDQVINIDDLLHAWRQVPSSGFSYTTHKLMQESTIVENPAGTPVTFIWCRFFLGTQAEPNYTGGEVDQNQPFPACTITVTGASVINYDVKATLELSAIRIEGNNKKLADLPEIET